MSFNQFYTRQEQVDAHTTHINNPNLVGSGYHHFGSMERTTATEALASNWQFAGSGAVEQQQPMGGVGAFAMPLAGTDSWAMPVAPRSVAAVNSAADRSHNWRDKSPQLAPSYGQDFSPTLAGSEGAFGSLPGSMSTLALGSGPFSQSPAGVAQPLSAQMLPLGSASLSGATLPSVLGALPQQANDGMGSCFMGGAASAPLGASYGAGSYIAGSYGASGYGACSFEATGSLPDAMSELPMAAYPAPDPYAASDPYQSYAPAPGLGDMPSNNAASVPRPAMAADARRAGYAGQAAQPGSKTALTAQAGKAQPFAASALAAPPQSFAEPKGLARLLTQEDYAAAAKAWKPPKATVLDSSSAVKAEAAKPAQQKASGPKEWACKRCSLINEPHARFCEVCNSDRVADHGHGDEDGWHSAAHKPSGSGASEQQQPLKSRASAKNAKRRGTKA
ncbi:hypothetical protein T492DRAFT_1034548 [Pavlovales sp. CCMP2436]|nr:hypothetical protein T492DRAFT_1034548 [Pavlovales sp. CCMP2436]|mmetsp:Transcript_45019/g.111542  ORF Transcript_45019/g.111542 Transcript_45019/m.111542 type:complete len:448 (+) Transcript_45019:75-1418(+)